MSYLDMRLLNLQNMSFQTPVLAKATVRSKDGRGPLWWAYEFGRNDMIALLINHGAKTDEPDKDGVLPHTIQK